MSLGGLACALFGVAAVTALKPIPPQTATATPAPGPTATPPPGPTAPTPAPKVSPSVTPTPEPEQPLPPDSASLAIARADKLVQEGREPAALDDLDAALAKTPSIELTSARAALLAALSARIARDGVEAEAAFLAGRAAEATARLGELRRHVPPSLASELQAVYGRIDALRAATAAATNGAEPSTELWRRLAALRLAAEARARQAHADVQVALGRLDAAKALEALEACGTTGETDVDAELAVERGRAEAVGRLREAALEGFKAELGREVSLELRAGGVATGTLKATTPALSLAGPGATMTLGLAELAPEALFARARKGAKDAADAALGRACLLEALGDTRGALEAADKAGTSPLAAALRERLRKLAAEPVVATPTTSSPTPAPTPGVVVSVPVGPPSPGLPPRPKKLPKGPKLSVEERKAAAEAARVKEGFKVYVCSKYYDVLSNGDLDEARDAAATMDLMCEEFKKIFGYKEEITRAFPIWLYESHGEFMAKTKQRAGIGGFYDGEKIVAFHGKMEGYEHNFTQVLFHEGTHQFQGLALGENLWSASLWFVEGLAVYFEASQVEGKRLVTDVIPNGRLQHAKRAFVSGEAVSLRDLLRVEHKDLTALHYAESWSLIYFFVHGTKGGLERFKKYFEGVKAGKDGLKLFEELFNKPLDQIESAWRDWVLNLR